MPVLHEYNPGYHKSGYYVKVNWSAPHPYPLQTPYITEQIYRELGFKPEDEIPNELTSRLFNAGLHWTEGNGPSDPEKQTNLDSISDTDLPNVDPEQLEKVYNLLANEEFSLDGRTVDNGSLSELKSELEELRDVGNKNKNSTIPSRPEPLISDLCNKNLTQEQATDIRESARNQGFFDRSIYQFTRKHPITPRGFGVNEYGNPAYRFQTGPVEWKLADCRARNLDFEWAVTIDPGTEREYGLRVSQTRLVRVIFDGQKLTKQQAVDLITIIPCLVWIFDVLSEYSLSDGWHGQEIRGDLPSPHHTWLTDQIDASTATKADHTDTAPNKGIVIDLPDRNFARIRSQGRDIICAPVNSLPDRIELGSEVTFETTQRYGSYYGKNITVANNPVTNVAQDAETIITFEETEDDFLIPKPVSELATETAVEIVLDILDSVCLQSLSEN